MRAFRPAVFFLAGCATAVAAEPTTGATGSAPTWQQETRPAILAPNASAAPRGGAGGGGAGASKKLRELLDRAPSGRAISPEMAAKLGEATKRVAPPAKPAAGQPSATATAEAGDAVMLDPYVVEEGKVPQMKEREMLTPAGKLAEARRRRPGLGAGVIPLGNDKVALELLEEDHARERRKEMEELGGLLKSDGGRVPAAVKKQIDAGAAQRPGWIDERGTRFREPR